MLEHAFDLRARAHILWAGWVTWPGGQVIFSRPLQIRARRRSNFSGRRLEEIFPALRSGPLAMIPKQFCLELGLHSHYGEQLRILTLVYYRVGHLTDAARATRRRVTCLWNGSNHS